MSLESDQKTHNHYSIRKTPQESSQAKLPTSPGVFAIFFPSNLLHNYTKSKKDPALLVRGGAGELHCESSQGKLATISAISNV